jgi:lipoprotein signal peptidase
LAAVADLATKQLAVSLLGSREIALGEGFSLMVVWNIGGPGGGAFGPTMWLSNVVMTTLAVIIMSVVAADLGRFNKLGAIALGLVTGGALGNLASMVAGPAGVADFLALHLADRSIVFNVADIALWSGAVLQVPVVVLLLRAIRSERENKSRHTTIAAA